MFESGNAAFQPMEKARNGSIEKVITIEWHFFFHAPRTLVSWWCIGITHRPSCIIAKRKKDKKKCGKKFDGYKGIRSSSSSSTVIASRSDLDPAAIKYVDMLPLKGLPRKKYWKGHILHAKNRFEYLFCLNFIIIWLFLRGFKKVSFDSAGLGGPSLAGIYIG